MKKHYAYTIFFSMTLALGPITSLWNTLYAQNLKVFILAGQSNMVGNGVVEPATTSGTLANFITNDPSETYNTLQNTDGSWATRNDVWLRFDNDRRGLLTGALGVDFGRDEGLIGPELGFGNQLGDHYEDQVLLIKTAWGGKSLAVDFRPPSASGATGAYYTKMIAAINTALSNIADEFPVYRDQPIEIAGFCWFQGWNDGANETYTAEYYENLKYLIKDIRTDLAVPDLPFVIGLTGIGGYELIPRRKWVHRLQTLLVPEQIRVAEASELSRVSYADTRSFWREGTVSPAAAALHHWNNNGESYLRIGNELGLEMIELLEGRTLSRSDVESQGKVVVFPSPIKDHFVVSGSRSSYTVNIYDLVGQEVTTIRNIEPLRKVYVPELKEGVYFIEILNKKNEKIALTKVIKG